MSQSTNPTAPTRHRTRISDSARWDGIVLRPDDIIVSVPPKCGTTWTQMICALLVFGTADLPAPMATLSAWPDLLVHPIDEVRVQLEGQTHRRFIKSHAPLDALPTAPGVTFIVTGRDPRDVLVSLKNFVANIRTGAVEERASAIAAAESLLAPGGVGTPPADRPKLTFLDFVLNNDPPAVTHVTLRNLVEQFSVAWERRNDPDVVLLHYADLSRDLAGQMRGLAQRLGIEVREEAWPELVEAATFDRMKANVDNALSAGGQFLIDRSRFFSSGTSGQWRDVLTEDDLAVYEQRLAELAPPDLVHWLHHGANDGING